ncbi:MAG: Rap1a/Tai family immunity protein [Pseudomonadota bacterium]
MKTNAWIVLMLSVLVSVSSQGIWAMTPMVLSKACEISAAGSPVEGMSKQQLVAHTLCLFYVRGVVEGVAIGAAQMAISEKNIRSTEVEKRVARLMPCFPDGDEKTQNKLLGKTVVEYFKAHPSDLTDSSKVPYLVWKAFTETFPCK